MYDPKMKNYLAPISYLVSHYIYEYDISKANLNIMYNKYTYILHIIYIVICFIYITEYNRNMVYLYKILCCCDKIPKVE